MLLPSDTWRFPIRREHTTMGVITKVAMMFTCELSMIIFGFACCCESFWICKSKSLFLTSVCQVCWSRLYVFNPAARLIVTSLHLVSEAYMIGDVDVSSLKGAMNVCPLSRLYFYILLTFAFSNSSGWTIKRPWKVHCTRRWPRCRRL
jgi:hypothetical protein